MKIYNEVVIDMNPESATFEQTIHEDSFEYHGDLMKMAKEWTDFILWGYGQDGTPYYVKYRIGASNKKTYEGAVFKGENKVQIGNNMKRGGNRSDYSNSFEMAIMGENSGLKSTKEYDPKATQGDEAGEYRDYGAPNITKEMFYEADGRRKDISEVEKVIEENFGPQDKTKMRLAIDKQMPMLEDIDVKEVGFLMEEYGGADPGPDGIMGTEDDGGETSFGESLAGEAAGQAREADVYGLQKGAKKLGAQARGVYGGGGAGMRAQISGAETLSKGFEAAEDKYGLSKEEAGLQFRKGMYDLEKKRFDESEFSSWLTENFADAGGN